MEVEKVQRANGGSADASASACSTSRMGMEQRPDRPLTPPAVYLKRMRTQLRPAITARLPGLGSDKRLLPADLGKHAQPPMSCPDSASAAFYQLSRIAAGKVKCLESIDTVADYGRMCKELKKMAAKLKVKLESQVKAEGGARKSFVDGFTVADVHNGMYWVLEMLAVKLHGSRATGKLPTLTEYARAACMDLQRFARMEMAVLLALWGGS